VPLGSSRGPASGSGPGLRRRSGSAPQRGPATRPPASCWRT
jgi:hypothetical protein